MVLLFSQTERQLKTQLGADNKYKYRVCPHLLVSPPQLCKFNLSPQTNAMSQLSTQLHPMPSIKWFLYFLAIKDLGHGRAATGTQKLKYGSTMFYNPSIWPRYNKVVCFLQDVPRIAMNCPPWEGLF